MQPLQILLIVAGLVAAGGGVMMLLRTSRDRNRSPRAAYTPLVIVFIGLMVAYKAFSDYQTMDTMDLIILFLFAVALMGLLGLQFFVIDRYRRDHPDRE